MKQYSYRDSAGERFALLAAMGEQVFHADDLANLWRIRKAATLHMTLSRYVAQGLLHRIQKGLYSLKPPCDLSPYLIGLKALHGPAYISGETVLFEAGVINQPPRSITINSSMSKQFQLAGNEYRSRQLAAPFLFNAAGINYKNGVRIAELPRAVADTLYFNPKKHFDAPTIVPWGAVRDAVQTVGYPLSIMQRYGNATR